MALFGGSRDISLFRGLSRELVGDIISQQAAIYKPQLAETKVNIYGEAANEKYYHPPVLLYCLIEIPNQEYKENGLGPDFSWSPTFKFLRDDLLASTSGSCEENNDNPNGANILPQVGDIIMYQEAYFQIDNVNVAQFFVGKDPEYPFTDATGNNPLENDLNQFGYNVAVICETHYVPADKVQIQVERF